VADSRQRWFWGLLASLAMLFVFGSTLSYCLFQRAPRLAERSIVEVEEDQGILPVVPDSRARDVIGRRLPLDTHWVLEFQGMRNLAIELRDEASSMAHIQPPVALDQAGQGFIRALPFDTTDPLDWIRSGYDMTEPWAVAWVSEGAEDAGAWVLFLPVRNHDSARKTTRALLRAWQLDERPVAWTWDADYHQVVIEEDLKRSAAARIQEIADSVRETSFASGPEMLSLNLGLGGEWNVRLRCMDIGRGDLGEILGRSKESGPDAWPFLPRSTTSRLGMALRLGSNHQRVRIGLVGPELAALRVNEGMGDDPEERQEIPAERVPEALGLQAGWWESLQSAGPAVRSSLEQVQVVAEIGPSGLVVDLRSSGRLDTWEPLVQWWISLTR
jgi:hypothetical protein